MDEIEAFDRDGFEQRWLLRLLGGSVAVRSAGQAAVICGGLLMKRASRTAARRDRGVLPRHFICPFLIMCMNSMPLRMTRAQRKSLNPSIGRVMRLMARWSCSTTLFRYLTLTNLDGRLALGVHRVQRGQIGAAFVDGYRLGYTVLIDRLFKEAPRSSLVPLGSEQEIDGVASPCPRPGRGTSTGP